MQSLEAARPVRVTDLLCVCSFCVLAHYARRSAKRRRPGLPLGEKAHAARSLTLSPAISERASPGKSMIQIHLNDKPCEFDADPAMPLLWALRDTLSLTGTKFGCGLGVCGACTVLIDGVPARSCQTPVGGLGKQKVITIEGLSGKVAGAVQDTWTRLDVPQCGYCQSGQVLTATALLASNRRPTDDDIDEAMGGNLCRCATYHRIRAAIHSAAALLGS